MAAEAQHRAVAPIPYSKMKLTATAYLQVAIGRPSRSAGSIVSRSQRRGTRTGDCRKGHDK